MVKLLSKIKINLKLNSTRSSLKEKASKFAGQFKLSLSRY